MKIAKRLIRSELRLSSLEGYLDALVRMEQPPADWKRHIRSNHVLPSDLLDAQMIEGELAALVDESMVQYLLRILYRKLFEESN